MPDATPASSAAAIPADAVGRYDRRSGIRPEPTPAQRRAVEARRPLVALSAGAGSGKTKVLVDRFLALVDEGVSPLAILAVTFTDKAALKMKERIVVRFAERGDDENRRKAEVAYISTLHGFCARLLREHPLEARLDPAFAVMDDLTRGLFLDEALESLYEDEWFRERVELFAEDRETKRPVLFELIHDSAFAAREFGRAAPAEAAFDVEQHVRAALERIDQFWAAELAAGREQLLAVADAIRGLAVKGPASQAKHRAMCEVLDALEGGAVLDRELVERFSAVKSFTSQIGQGQEQTLVRDALNLVKDRCGDFAKFDRAEEEALEREHLAPLKVGIYERAERLRVEYEAFKRRRSLLDFEDMQSRSLELLGDPDVRAEWTGRFAHILLDEAQDTNQVQMQLVDVLRGGGASLFAVGDAKQAIYGFRGADVALFERVCGEAGEGRLTLADNFRSRSEVIDLVNACGERLWAGERAIQFEPLAPRFPYEPRGDQPRVDVRFLTAVSDELEDGTADDETTGAVREREAALVARTIRELVEGSPAGGPTVVLDPDSKQYRPARYGDVALLARSRTHFPVYERYLAEAGIPFVRDGGRGFFSTREVGDVVNAMRALANPLDDVALVATLRSPMFAWADADLLRLRRAAKQRRLWRALGRGFAPERARSDARAYDTLVQLRAFAAAMPPAELMELLLDRTAYRAALLQTPRGRAQVANVNKLVEFARASTLVDGPSLAHFVQRAAHAERHLGREPDAALASTGDDVVVLSTIHGAKGLEWPVVVLPALDTDFARTKGGSMYSAPDGVLCVAPNGRDGGPIRARSSELVRRRMREREEAEARRLFYVALTRAREQLVLSGCLTYPKDGAWKGAGFRKPIDWLAAALDVGEHDTGSRNLSLGGAALRLTFVQPEEPEPPVASPALIPLQRVRAGVQRGEPVAWPSDDGEASETAVRSATERLLGPASRNGSGGVRAPAPGVSVSTVTQLTYFVRCPMVYYLDLVLQVKEHPFGRRKAIAGRAGADREGLSALDLGTKVHALLERADFAASPQAEARRLASSDAELPAVDRPRVERMIDAVLRDPLMDRARGARRLEREYPFYLRVDGTVVEGVLDLVFEDAEGRGVVVDYKSNDVTASDRVSVLTRHYRPQIELYALAAKRAGLVDPAEATLYFLNKPEARTLTVSERRLDEVQRETGDALARIGRGAWDTEPGEKCRNCGYRKRGYCEVGKQWRE